MKTEMFIHKKKYYLKVNRNVIVVHNSKNPFGALKVKTVFGYISMGQSID